jgi:hypothetical protein
MQSSTQFFVQLNSGKLIYWECCLKALGEHMYVLENWKNGPEWRNKQIGLPKIDAKFQVLKLNIQKVANKEGLAGI